MHDAGRDAILTRVRQALRAPSPRPHWLDQHTGGGPVFPLPPSDEESLASRFKSEFEAVQGQFHSFDSVESAQSWLVEFLPREGLRSILAPDMPLLRSLAGERLGVTWIKSGNDSTHGWDQFDAGLTTCESLVAESGTIVVSAALSGRAMSVLPPTHVAVATRDQFVPDLDTSIARLRARYGDSLPSTISWVTGPSRTADIEKILVLGAHGPKRLVLVLLPTNSLHQS